MRTIGFIEHPAYKITVFSWNERYIVKIEAGYYEQAYKFRQDEFTHWEDIKTLFDAGMLNDIQQVFRQMAENSKNARQRFNNRPGIV
jgi:hypothetical protein